MRRAVRAIAVLGWVLVAASCARRPPGTLPPASTVAAYRATWVGEEGARTFRVLAAVSAPAGLHLEIPDALGRTVVVVDCDGENLAVAWPRRRRVFRGAATEETFRRLLGAPLPPESWVALLRGLPVSDLPPGLVVVRRRGGGWPARLEIEMEGGAGRLVLRLRSVQPLRARGPVANPDRWTGWAPAEPLDRLLDQGGLWPPGAGSSTPEPSRNEANPGGVGLNFGGVDRSNCFRFCKFS